MSGQLPRSSETLSRWELLRAGWALVGAQRSLRRAERQMNLHVGRVPRDKRDRAARVAIAVTDARRAVDRLYDDAASEGKDPSA